jgi:hypothetical protein
MEKVSYSTQAEDQVGILDGNCSLTLCVNNIKAYFSTPMMVAANTILSANFSTW